jgi:RNA polymerase sigma-70 factor (ECF subfamily)
MTQPEPLAANLVAGIGVETTGVPSSDLEAFIAEHHPRLLHLARIVCRDSDDAGDVVQAAFVRAWSKRTSVRDAAHLRGWLDRIVVHEAIRNDRGPWWRKRVAASSRSTEDTPLVEPSDPRAGLMADWSALRLAFERLPAEQRAALALHLDAGYSIAETAEIMGTPHETARSRIRLAKERLRRDLGGTG